MSLEVFDAALLVLSENSPLTLMDARMPETIVSEEATLTIPSLPGDGCGCNRGRSDDGGILTSESSETGLGGRDLNLMAIDLWAQRGGEQFHSVDRAEGALRSSASWLGQLILSEPEHILDLGETDSKNLGLLASTESSDGNYVDENGNGQYDEGEEIIVTGTRPRTVDEDPWEGDPGGDTGGGSEGGVGGGDMPGEQEPPDCRDTKALEADQTIDARDDDHRRESGVVTYRDSAGNIRNSSVIVGDGDKIFPQDIINTMNREGISFTQVIAFTHNHDARHYAVGATWQERYTNQQINRYPSENDWNFADFMVGNGAGGAGGQGFAMYIIDTTGDLREFNYKDADVYRDLTDSQKRVGTDLPDETVAGSC